MNQVLKRHPLALRYIRYQLTERVRREAKQHTDNELESDSERDELDSTVRSYNLHSEESRKSSHRYQESLPLNHFFPRSDTQ